MSRSRSILVGPDLGRLSVPGSQGSNRFLVLIPVTLNGWDAWLQMSAGGRVLTWLGVKLGQKGAAIYRVERA